MEQPGNEKVTSYSSAKVILDMVKNEYDNEFSRISALENKVYIAITLSVALLAIICPLTNFQAILHKHLNTVSDFIVPVICLLSIIASFISIFFALYNFLKVLSLHQYFRIVTNNYIHADIFSKEENVIAFTIASDYNDAIMHNNIITDKRLSQYQKAIKCIIVSLIFLVISCFLKYNFI